MASIDPRRLQKHVLVIPWNKDGEALGKSEPYDMKHAKKECEEDYLPTEEEQEVPPNAFQGDHFAELNAAAFHAVPSEFPPEPSNLEGVEWDSAGDDNRAGFAALVLLIVVSSAALSTALFFYRNRKGGSSGCGSCGEPRYAPLMHHTQRFEPVSRAFYWARDHVENLVVMIAAKIAIQRQRWNGSQEPMREL